MPSVKIDQEKCKGCLLCVSVCPKGLIKAGGNLNKKGINPVVFSKGDCSGPAPYKSQGDCSGCLSCVLVCPDCCIEAYR